MEIHSGIQMVFQSAHLTAFLMALWMDVQMAQLWVVQKE
jgi:hypothetical protein